MVSKIFHKLFVYNRRMSVLSNYISDIIKKFNCKEILDIGCGDGKIDNLIMQTNNVNISGIDVLVRDKTYIPVTEYDGSHINKDDNSIDTTMIIDVLHHTENPDEVFKEIVRVTKNYIIIKDHFLHGFISYIKLKMMDYVGNKHYSVDLPYNYLTPKQWKKLFNENNLKVVYCKKDLNLYKGLLHILFDSNLHFIIVLKKG